VLTVITGPMFAGKTKELQSIYEANVIAENAVHAFKPSNDTRYSNDCIASHDGDEIPSTVLDKDDPYYDFCRFLPMWGEGVLFFEEAQFFNKEEFTKLVRELLYGGRDMVIAGLPCDSFGRPFGAMPELLSMADSIITKKAVCVLCKTIASATRTYRKIKSTAQVVVGGAEAYEPRCFKCWKDGLHDSGCLE